MQSELAEHLGCSRSNLIRWGVENGVSLNAHSYKPEVRRRVCAYYELHGKAKTQEAFPEVSVRSIVESSYGKFQPRQVRWTDDQLIEATRMSGLVSTEAQAKYFNRPRANAGSIKSLWTKRFGFMGGQINGMPHNQAKHLLNQNARYIKTPGGMRICLWVTMTENLKCEVPPFIADAVHTLADFQRWLWRSENPKPLIMRMIKERELELEA